MADFISVGCIFPVLDLVLDWSSLLWGMECAFPVLDLQSNSLGVPSPDLHIPSFQRSMSMV